MTTSPKSQLGLLPLVIASLLLSAQPKSAAAFLTQSSNVGPPGARSLLRFEVASIRAHQSSGDEPSNRQILPGGRFVATATNVRTLIRIASGIDDQRVSGAPSWIDSETFDITAITTNHTEVTTTQQFQQLVLSLLEDRFQFRFHHQEKGAPVYWLELNKPGKLGPALKVSTPTSQPNMSTNSNGPKATMKISQMSMADCRRRTRTSGRAAGRGPHQPQR